jgi:hypothetical protein
MMDHVDVIQNDYSLLWNPRGLTLPGLQKSPENTYSIFAHWALFEKGGWNFKIISDCNASGFPNEGILYAQMAPITYDNIGITPDRFQNSYGRHGTVLEDMTYKPSLEFSYPYYNTLPFIGTVDAFPNEKERNQLSLTWKIKGTPGTNTFSGSIWLAARDDHAFFWFCAPPVMRYTHHDPALQSPPNGSVPVPHGIVLDNNKLGGGNPPQRHFLLDNNSLASNNVKPTKREV